MLLLSFKCKRNPNDYIWLNIGNFFVAPEKPEVWFAYFLLRRHRCPVLSYQVLYYYPAGRGKSWSLPLSEFLLANVRFIVPKVWLLKRKELLRCAVRSVLPVIISRCCLWLTYKTVRVLCSFLMSIFQLRSSCFTLVFSSSRPSSSLCDITVWLARMENQLWKYIWFGLACSQPYSHSRGRHTSPLMHTHPHISTLLWYLAW